MCYFPEDLPVPRIDPQDQNDGDLDVGRIEEQPSASEESGDDLEDEIPGAYVLIARALNTACQTNTLSTFSAVQRVVAKRIFACFVSTCLK